MPLRWREVSRLPKRQKSKVPWLRSPYITVGAGSVIGRRGKNGREVKMRRKEAQCQQDC